MDEEPIVFPSQLQERILSTLEYATGPVSGLLLGRWHNETLMVVSAYHCSSTDSEDIKCGIKEVGGHFPGGIDICGMYYSYPSNTGEDAIMRQVRQNCAALKDDFGEVNLLICIHQQKLSQSLLDQSFWYHIDARETSPATKFTESRDELASMWQDLVMFRLRRTCQIIVPYNADPVKFKQSVGVELQLQIDALTSSRTAYHVTNSRVLIHNPGDEVDDGDEDGPRDEDEPGDEVGRAGRKWSGVEPHDPCGEILQMIDTGEEMMTRRKIKDYSQEVINVSVMTCATPQTQKEKSAFMIYVDEEPIRYVTGRLDVDCMVVAESSEPVGNLPALFSATIAHQLTSATRSMCTFYTDGVLPRCRPVHIRPLGMDHPITVYYPEGYTDDQLVDHRTGIQSRLHLPLDRPLLRTSNQYIFPDERKGLVYLQNTHVGLPKSGVAGGVVSCVQGVYSYHHYMQDNMNDNGWGCAYRSLQTIVSWFRHQGYTDVPVPTHAQIQQALVDIGDKEASFVGSRKWIGSTEVGFVLDQLLEVQSRYLVVNAGSELVDKGRELAQHFTQQGTPIMIGGGVLAHTILGVDFNQQTGDVRFLILDPHYTGPEDIKEIQSKGWCGWKGPEFWDRTAFYNLCMPQRPKLV